jgi:DNA-binding transcriptional MerR regulator
MKTVKEVSALTGVSIRTLHHYDAIGLLCPTQVTEAGYRLYDHQALRRLQTILLLKQLRFPLKEIANILDSPGFDPVQALEDQIRLLELQREHLDGLIAHARSLQKTGGLSMDFSAFDERKQERYAAEAKKKWGSTDAWKECEQKTKGQTNDQLRSTGDGLMDIFTEIGAIRHTAPESAEAQALVEKLRRYITDHYYTCTPQILRGLGQLYIAGDEMTENINRAGGDGTAEFAHRAIEIYCTK